MLFSAKMEIGLGRIGIRVAHPRFVRIASRSAILGLALLWLVAELKNGASAIRSDDTDRGDRMIPARAVMGRRLLAVPDDRKEVLEGLEEVLLEPPASKRNKEEAIRTRYLPDLTGDTLEKYPRRVFIDVGPPGGATSAASWFVKHYPTRDRDFEMIRVDVVAGDGSKKEADEGMAEWLVGNVREEEYVVVKAEAEVVEEVVKGGAIGLVDELFLECRNQWTRAGRKGGKSRRAYWECLALYGMLRDQGVAVHQWWG